MLSRLAPLCDCGLLVPSALPCAEAALPGGGNTAGDIFRDLPHPSCDHMGVFSTFSTTLAAAASHFLPDIQLLFGALLPVSVMDLFLRCFVSPLFLKFTVKLMFC